MEEFNILVNGTKELWSDFFSKDNNEKQTIENNRKQCLIRFSIFLIFK